MNTTFDLDVLPLHRRGGYDQADLPGLHLAAPTRRPARGRAGDLLVLFLTLKGNAPFSSAQQDGLLEELAKIYYGKGGSVTAALRATAERLNDFLLERNLRSTSSGMQALGLLTLVAAHGDHLYLAQAGSMHAFTVTDAGVDHIVDGHQASRGLGVSRTAQLRFAQAALGSGGLLILTPDPPPTWSAASLAGCHKLPLGQLYRHLLDGAGPDVSAVVLIAQPGAGALHLLQRAPAESSTPPTGTTPSDQEASPRPSTPMAPPPKQPAYDTDDLAPAAALAPVTTASPTPEPTARAPVAEVQPPPAEPAIELQPTAEAQESPLADTAPPRASLRQRALGTVGPALLSAGRALDESWGRVRDELRTFVGRMLPGEGLLTLSSTVMAFIAISVPLIVVTIASVVYFQRGRAAQYQANFDQARRAAEGAVSLGDPLEQRSAWDTTLFYLSQAEEYQITPESRALRSIAQDQLDQLNGVVRLAFAPAILGGLSDGVLVRRLVATTDELYLLNGTDGSVLRAILTGRGYELDPTFRCEPGSHGGTQVGQLIDIAPLPKGNDLNATLVGMDASGNLLYCLPENSPLAAPLPPPDSNWGNPLAVTVDTGVLYVLDPMTNAVWVYRGVDGTYPDRPNLFFSEDVPPMQDVIDLAVNRQDLYLLHADGHLTTCTFSAFQEAPTRCTDPAMFSDPRPGRQDGNLIPDALFTQIRFSPPPDPSIYILDPDTHAIYHFSLRLTFQRQFRPSESLPDEPATAFTTSANRTAFLAFGRQVYYATFP